jgi:hypothetical protein
MAAYFVQTCYGRVCVCVWYTVQNETVYSWTNKEFEMQSTWQSVSLEWKCKICADELSVLE